MMTLISTRPYYLVQSCPFTRGLEMVFRMNRADPRRCKRFAGVYNDHSGPACAHEWEDRPRSRRCLTVTNWNISPPADPARTSRFDYVRRDQGRNASSASGVSSLMDSLGPECGESRFGGTRGPLMAAPEVVSGVAERAGGHVPHPSTVSSNGFDYFPPPPSTCDLPII